MLIFVVNKSYNNGVAIVHFSLSYDTYVVTYLNIISHARNGHLRPRPHEGVNDGHALDLLAAVCDRNQDVLRPTTRTRGRRRRHPDACRAGHQQRRRGACQTSLKNCGCCCCSCSCRRCPAGLVAVGCQRGPAGGGGGGSGRRKTPAATSRGSLRQGTNTATDDKRLGFGQSRYERRYQTRHVRRRSRCCYFLSYRTRSVYVSHTRYTIPTQT